MSVAFFDMDRTVLRVNSGAEWMRFLYKRGDLSTLGYAQALWWLLRYKMAVIDIVAVTSRLAARHKGDGEAELRQLSGEWFQREIAPQIAQKACQAIEEHRRRGDRLVLLTTSTPYIAEPLAAALRIDHVLCSRLEIDEGRFTGRVVLPLCYGQGKVTLAEEWAQGHGVDLAEATFYTDSFSDLPMLKRVGRPVAVNPDLRLAYIAAQELWPIQIWDCGQ